MKTTIYLSVLLVLTSKAFAFSLNSTTNPSFRGWESNEIQFQLNAANCPASVDVRGLMDEAMAIWNNVPSSNVKLVYAGETTSTTASNPITVFCDTAYDAPDTSPGAANVLPTTGDIINRGLMHLNATSGRANIANFSRDLVLVTLAHEFGHLIGLGHSQDTAALMYYDATAKTSFSLAQDDMDAISYLYPRDETKGDKPLGGCGLVQGAVPPSAGPGRGLGLLILLLPVFVYLGLRQKMSSNTLCS